MPGFLHNTCAVMRRETGRITRQPMYFVLMIVLPVVSFAFFALLFNQGAIRNIPIAVLDQDNTTLSRKAVQMIDDTPTAMVAYGIQGMDEGERLMREGRIMAIVQIPAFFEKNILSNSQTRLENYVSGTNITVNGLLSKDIQTAVTTFTAGIQLQVLMKQGLTQRQAMAQLMPVRFNKHVLFNPYINYGYYLSPSFMPMMLLIFVVMVTVFAIGTELKHATAREWLPPAPAPLMIPAGTHTLAINPLNWKTDSTPAGKEENLGACFTDYSGNIITEIPQLTGAYIDPQRGALKVPDVTPEEYPPVLSIFSDGIYHLYDYQFFYRNLQENVEVRLNAYLEDQAA